MNASPSSDTSGDPINELVVQPAKKRPRSPVRVTETELLEATSLSDGEIPASNEEEDEVYGDATRSETAELDSQVEDFKLPAGVVLYDPRDQDTEQQWKIAKLLRAPRYFEISAQEETVRCVKCGQGGHLGQQCPNKGIDIRPCTLCAQYGHMEKECPNRLCFKCGETGHKSRECKKGKQQGKFQQLCLRCGSYNCNASGRHDCFRYEGGCDQPYQDRDLSKVVCLTCGNLHNTFCCAPLPDDTPSPSCALCGQQGHWMEECSQPLPQHLLAERISKYNKRNLVQEEDQLREAYGEPQRKRPRYEQSNSNRGQWGGNRGRRGGRGQYHQSKQQQQQDYQNGRQGGQTTRGGKGAQQRWQQQRN
eukprot:TRINITY_DN2507_c0_g1_i10.p1 TRINITY_DN2507_c0_g1~~TRINITY_DN2507_c0_g1_i10.p1  ORF type:complete len:375 (-),score=43.62 TRINITY_DN2507_c0_g1_i10:344-1432(-)